MGSGWLIGPASARLEENWNPDWVARLPLEVRLEDVDELERVGRANDAPELDRELLDDRDDVLEEDERELLFRGLGHGSFESVLVIAKAQLYRSPFRSNLTRPVLASIAVISIAPCLSPTGI